MLILERCGPCFCHPILERFFRIYSATESFLCKKHPILQPNIKVSMSHSWYAKNTICDSLFRTVFIRFCLTTVSLLLAKRSAMLNADVEDLSSQEGKYFFLSLFLLFLTYQTTQVTSLELYKQLLSLALSTPSLSRRVKFILAFEALRRCSR